MSSTRQLGTSGSLLRRNSGTEPNISAPSPTDRKRLVSALRREGSSSITNTTGCSSGASFVISHGTLANHRKKSIRSAVLQVAHVPPRGLRWASGRPTAPYRTIGPGGKEGVVSASRWCALGKLPNPFAQARDLDRDRDGRVIYV